MRIPFALVTLLVPALASAGPSRPRRDPPPPLPPVTAPAPPPAPVAPPPPAAPAARHEEWFSTTPGAEFHLSYDVDPAGQARFKVLQPEGFGIRVSDTGREYVRDTIPTSIAVPAGGIYRLEIYDSARVFFDRRFEAQAGMVGALRVPAPGGSLLVPTPPPGPVTVPPPTAPQPPPPPAAPAAPTCASDVDLGNVIAAIDHENFGDSKLDVLRSATRDRWYCSEQVIRVIGRFSFSHEKLDALAVMAPHRVDRANDFRIIGAFTFDRDKNEARKILKSP